MNQVRRDVSPQPQVLVDVEAAGVNFVDTVILTGGYQFAPPLPYVPGSEFAGRILAVPVPNPRSATPQEICKAIGQVAPRRLFAEDMQPGFQAGDYDIHWLERFVARG